MAVARWQRNGGSWKMLEYRLLVTRSIHSRALMYSTMTIGNSVVYLKEAMKLEV